MTMSFEDSLRNDEEEWNEEMIPLKDLFEKMRRGIGKGYALLTEHNHLTKRMVGHLKRGDVEGVEALKRDLFHCWNAFKDLCFTDQKYLELSSMAGQELIEFLAVEALWPYVRM